MGPPLRMQHHHHHYPPQQQQQQASSKIKPWMWFVVGMVCVYQLSVHIGTRAAQEALPALLEVELAKQRDNEESGDGEFIGGISKSIGVAERENRPMLRMMMNQEEVANMNNNNDNNKFTTTTVTTVQKQDSLPSMLDSEAENNPFTLPPATPCQQYIHGETPQWNEAALYTEAYQNGLAALTGNNKEDYDANGVPQSPNIKRSAFDQVYDMAVARASTPILPFAGKQRRTFDLKAWHTHQCVEKGGLVDSDRQLLGKLYHAANSVMEFGLGESTYIAAAVDVPVYVGIDSDATWVSQSRNKAPPHFQFLAGDIGATREWGFPHYPKLPKSALLYEVMPLFAQKQAFDVYFIDGRWRPACVLLSFLHASARGAAAASSSQVKVGIHDYWERTYYHRLEEILEVTDRSERTAFFQRKSTTTDHDILQLYLYYDRACRQDLPAHLATNIDGQRELGC